MLLKPGELAKRSGLTIRTLHYYRQIALLVPSARSDCRIVHGGRAPELAKGQVAVLI